MLKNEEIIGNIEAMEKILQNSLEDYGYQSPQQQQQMSPQEQQNQTIDQLLIKFGGDESKVMEFLNSQQR